MFDDAQQKIAKGDANGVFITPPEALEAWFYWGKYVIIFTVGSFFIGSLFSIGVLSDLYVTTACIYYAVVSATHDVFLFSPDQRIPKGGAHYAIPVSLTK